MDAGVEDVRSTIKFSMTMGDEHRIRTMPSPDISRIGNTPGKDRPFVPGPQNPLVLRRNTLNEALYTQGPHPRISESQYVLGKRRI